MRSPAWSAEENRLIVEDYFAMLEAELRGGRYNKAEHNRELQRLVRRSRESIEFKHQNLSALLLDLGLPSIDGYKPRRNYQAALLGAVGDFLQTHPHIDKLLAEKAGALPREASLMDWASSDRSVAAPPAFTARPEEVRDPPWRPSSIDYVRRERENSRLGRLGEEFAYLAERARLERAGRRDLSRRVEWTSRDRGDGWGYDLRSFDPSSDREVCIEVKTTNAGIYTPFFVTQNEVRTSETSDEIYRLFRVFQFDRDPRYFIKDGALSRTCDLLPQIYRARLR